MMRRASRSPSVGDETDATASGCASLIVSDEAPAASIPRSAPTPTTYVEDRTPVRKLEFVEVGAGVGGTPVGRSRDHSTDGRQSRQAGVESEARPETAFEARPEVESLQEATMAFEPGAPETRWSLWGDLEG